MAKSPSTIFFEGWACSFMLAEIRRCVNGRAAAENAVALVMGMERTFCSFIVRHDLDDKAKMDVNLAASRTCIEA
jgi:hypothetical protein